MDNASPDKTADIVQSEFPEVHLVRNTVNVGYARAVNQGFALADTPYVFLLNPDIRIPAARGFGGCAVPGRQRRNGSGRAAAIQGRRPATAPEFHMVLLDPAGFPAYTWRISWAVFRTFGAREGFISQRRLPLRSPKRIRGGRAAQREVLPLLARSRTSFSN